MVTHTVAAHVTGNTLAHVIVPFDTPVTGRYLRYVVNAVVTSGEGHGWWSACMYEMTIWAPGYGPTPPPPPGALDHLVLTPATQTIVPNAHVTYTAEGFDAANNSLGAITDAVLDINADGSCSAYDCTSSTPGDHTVTATKSAKTGTATLTVWPPAPSTTSSSPRRPRRSPPAHQTYTAEGFDAANISLGAITDAVLDITPDGSCSAYDCTASTPATTPSPPPRAARRARPR